MKNTETQLLQNHVARLHHAGGISVAQAEKQALAITRTAAFRNHGLAGLAQTTRERLESLLVFAAQVRADRK